jgi:hypothetical protein
VFNLTQALLPLIESFFIMHRKAWISLVALVGAASAAPVALEERDKGIYVYYPPAEEKRDVGIYEYYASPKGDAKEKRDVGIYEYYASPKDESKEKRDTGIYVYYPPAEDKREAAPQDFEDQVARDA